MSWAVPEIITVLSGCFSLSLVFFYLYFIDRKNYLAIWGVSWLFFVLRSILDLCYYLIDQSTTLSVASHLATLTSALLLFGGTDVFTGKNRGIRFYLTVLFVLLSVSTIAFQFDSFWIRATPAYFFLGAIHLWTGVTLLRAKQLSSFGRQLTGWSIILLGLHNWDYPFLANQPSLTPWIYLIATLLEILVAQGILLTFYDVTRRGLSRRSAHLKAIFDNAAIGIIISDADGNYREVNRRWAEMSGYTQEELLKIDQKLVFHPDDLPTANNNLKKIQDGTLDIYQTERRFIRKDSSTFWGQLAVSTIRLPSGQLDTIIGMVTDISRRKQAEATLKRRSVQQEHLLHISRQIAESLDVHQVLERIAVGAKEILDAYGCIIFLLTLDGNSLQPVIALIPEYADEYLSTPASLEGSFTGQAVRARKALIFNDAAFNESGQEVPGTPAEEDERVLVAPFISQDEVLGAMCVTRKGEFFTEEDQALVETFAAYASTAMRNAQAHHTLQREIEERRRITEELRISDERFRLAFMTGPDAITINRLSDGKYIQINQGFTNLTGYSEIDVSEMTSIEMGIWADPAERNKLIEGLREFGQVRNMEAQFRLKDGRLQTGMMSASIFYLDNEPHILSITRDISEQKEAERALVMSEQRYRSLFENSPISLWEEDFSLVKAYVDELHRQGIFDLQDYFNKHPEEILHCIDLVRVLAVNRTTLDVYKAKDHASSLGDLSEIATEETANSFIATILAVAQRRTSLQIETINQTLTGEKLNIELRWSVAPGYEQDYSKVLVSIEDVTERRRAQAELQQKTLQQERLIQTARDLTASLDLHQVLSHIALGAKEILDAYGCSVYFLEPDGKILTPVVAFEAKFQEQIMVAPLPVDGSLTGKCVRAGHGLIFNNAQSQEGGYHIPGTSDDEEHIIATPFIFDDQVMGAMCLNRSTPPFTPGDLALTETFAAYASSALKNAQAHDRLQREVEQRKRAQADLHMSEERYRHLFEFNRSVMLLVDPDSQQIVDANPAACAFYGYTQPEMTRRTLSDIIALSPDEYSQEFERSRAENREYHLHKHRLADGRLRHVQVYSSPINSNGMELAFSIVHDVTEQVQRDKEMETIISMATNLRSASRRNDMLPIIQKEIHQLLLEDTFALGLRDRPTGEITFVLATGLAEHLTRRSPSNESICNFFFEHGLYSYNHLLNHPDEISSYIPIQMLTESLAGISLIAKNEPIGVLLVGRGTPFDENEIRLLSGVGEIAANALHRATLHEETQRRLDHLVALHDIDKAITTNVEVESTLQVFLNKVITELSVDAADVLLFEAPSQSLIYKAGIGFRHRSVPATVFRIGRGPAGRVALDRRMIYIPNLPASEYRLQTGEPDVSAISSYPLSEGFITYFGVPLIAKNHVQGVLELYHRSLLEPDQEWLDFLDTLARQAAIAIDNARLLEELQRSNLELTLAYDTTLEGWARVLELRDKETKGHSQRVIELTEQLARSLGMMGEDLVHLRRGTLLHDIGKLGIPDHILLKPGPLTDDEKVIMHQHPTLAYQWLSTIKFLHPALEIPLHHHEKWDGSGYPGGLSGEQIPLAARIFAVVDVWDALLSDRPYRPACSIEYVRSYIREQAGKHFDPRIVEAFFNLLSKM